MYLHIGKGLILKEDDIIAIFNIDYIKNTKDYKRFYQKLLAENKIMNISEGKEKTFVVVHKNNAIKAYITNINSRTIGKRKF